MSEKYGMKRLLALLLGIVMVFTVIAACSGEDAGTGGDTTQPAGTTADSDDPSDSDDPGDSEDWISHFKEMPISRTDWLVSDEPVEIDIFIIENAEFHKYGDGTLNDIPVIQLINQATNMHFNWIEVPSVNHEERFNITIASGDMPDVFIYDYHQFMNYVPDGLWVPLNDLIDEHAPNIKYQLDLYPDQVRSVSHLDGNMYTLHRINEQLTSLLFMVRQDWLDYLGLEQPQSIDDVYDVFMALRDQDPNQTGEDDVIPYAGSRGREDLEVFMYPFGIAEDFFIEDGKVVFGAVDPRMKGALEWLNKAYEEKLIHPEYISMDGTQFNAMVTSETVGSSRQWSGTVDNMNAMVRPINPDAQWVYSYPPPLIGPEGPQKWRRAKERFQLGGGCLAISSTSDYAVEIIKTFDFWHSNPEGVVISNFGIEGIHFEWDPEWPSDRTPVEMVPGFEDLGWPMWTDMVLNPTGEYGSTPQQVMRAAGDMLWPKVQWYDKFQQYSPEREAGQNNYSEIIDENTLYPNLKFTQEELDVLNAVFVEIETFVDEQLDRFIMGTRSLDEFDDFVERVWSIGLDQVMEIHQNSYERYIAMD